MAKDCLQLEGDIHILNERIEGMRHNFIVNCNKFNDEINKIVKNSTEIVNEHIKKLRKDIDKNNGNFKKEITSRMNHLESYIKNERFHSILVELNKLEDEYHNEAIRIVNEMAVKK